MAIEKGSKVKVDYEGTLEDGTVFDASANHDAPLEFEVGAGHILPGFENAIMGKDVGDKAEITLNAEEAYGEVSEELVQTVARDQIPVDQKLEAGMVLAVSLPDGRQVPARITEADEKNVTVDMNHPLAGKTLKFKITVVEIVS